MLKYQDAAYEVTQRIIETKIRQERKQVNCKILNKYMALILRMEELSDWKAQKILNHDFHKNELEEYVVKYLKGTMENNLTKEHVHKTSEYLGLNSYDKRDEFRRVVAELAPLFIEVIDGDKESYWKFKDKYTELVFNKDSVISKDIRRIIPIGIVITLVNDKSNPLNLAIEDRANLKNLRIDKAKYIISDIQYEVGCLLGVRRRKKDTHELIDSFKDIVIDTTEEDEFDEFEETLESVKLERDQYKSSLKLIQNSLDELSENIKEETQMIVSEKIRDFFVGLNSARYGNFLDKIPLTESLLEQIQNDENYSEISQEEKKVFIFIKSVIKFIKDQDIETIEEMDRVFEARVEDIANMDYEGDIFFDDEVKKVKVVTPGYRYQGLTISIPKVKEVIE